MLMAAPARAGEAVIGYAGGLGGYVNGVGGWSFQPQQNIAVTALGSFEGTMVATGEPIAIGVWAADGSLLASNMVTAASSLVNQTVYEPIDPVALWAGQTYSIGVYAQGGTIIVIGVAPTEGSVTTAPDIRLGTAVASFHEFGFPGSIVGPDNSAILGPNFEYNVIPEPDGVVLLCCGVLGLAVARKRRTA